MPGGANPAPATAVANGLPRPVQWPEVVARCPGHGSLGELTRFAGSTHRQLGSESPITFAAFFLNGQVNSLEKLPASCGPPKPAMTRAAADLLARGVRRAAPSGARAAWPASTPHGRHAAADRAGARGIHAARGQGRTPAGPQSRGQFFAIAAAGHARHPGRARPAQAASQAGRGSQAGSSLDLQGPRGQTSLRAARRKTCSPCSTTPSQKLEAERTAHLVDVVKLRFFAGLTVP